MHISVCTDAVFAGKDTAEAMQLVKEAGFSAIEFWSWENKDIDAIDRMRRELDMKVVAFCTSFVSLTDPAARDAYLAGLKKSAEVAKRLDCGILITQVGNKLSMEPQEDFANIVRGLRACVPFLEERGIVLAIEPLNTRVDHGGYYLESSDEAARIIDEVGSSQVKMLFDFYHQQVTEGDVIRRSTSMLDRIAHFHAAGNPGRHELDLGELNYRAIFEALDRHGCEAYVGLEYMPLEAYGEGLKRIKEYA